MLHINRKDFFDDFFFAIIPCVQAGGFGLKNIKYFVPLIFVMCINTANAADNDLSNAINNVRNNCLGLSDELNKIKTRAGINTAITAVGTGTATGAVIAGVKKDKAHDEYKKMVIDAIKAEKLKLSEDKSSFVYDENDSQIKNIAYKDYEEFKLGNIRTGLMATSTATNIAGAVISSKNQVKDDLANMITKCTKSVSELYDVKMQAHLDKSADDSEIQYAENIINACDSIKNINISGINKKAKGAMILSAVGAGTGMAGTITSGVANSDKIRLRTNENNQNKVNTAANVLAGATGAVSLGATIFNATEIGAINKASDVITKCEGTLK